MQHRCATVGIGLDVLPGHVCMAGAVGRPIRLICGGRGQQLIARTCFGSLASRQYRRVRRHQRQQVAHQLFRAAAASLHSFDDPWVEARCGQHGDLVDVIGHVEHLSIAHACDVGAVCPTQYAQRTVHHFTVWHAPRASHGRASCRPSVACCIAPWRGIADLHSMPAPIFSRGRSLMAPPGRNTVRRCWRVLRGSCLGGRLLALRWRATGCRRGCAIRPEEIAKIVDGHLYCQVCRRSAPVSKTFHRPYVRSRHGTLPARKLLQRCEGAGAAAARRSRVSR